jgi:hypothetical protein
VTLTPEQRTYALASFVVIPAVANTVINGVLGWATFRGVGAVPLWSMGPAVGSDLVGTCLFLPFITCLIVTPLTRRHVRNGMVAPFVGLDLPSWLRLGPPRALARGALLGAACLAIVGGATAVALSALGVGPLTLTPLLFLKVAFSVLLGLLVTPVIGLRALADPAPAG